MDKPPVYSTNRVAALSSLNRTAANASTQTLALYGRVGLEFAVLPPNLSAYPCVPAAFADRKEKPAILPVVQPPSSPKNTEKAHRHNKRTPKSSSSPGTNSSATPSTVTNITHVGPR